MVLAIISLGLIVQNLVTEGNRSLLYFYLGLFGMAMVSVMPVSLGLGVELTFPLQQPLVTGVMLMGAQIQGTL